MKREIRESRNACAGGEIKKNQFADTRSVAILSLAGSVGRCGIRMRRLHDAIAAQAAAHAKTWGVIPDLTIFYLYTMSATSFAWT